MDNNLIGIGIGIFIGLLFIFINYFALLIQRKYYEKKEKEAILNLAKILNKMNGGNKNA